MLSSIPPSGGLPGIHPEGEGTLASSSFQREIKEAVLPQDSPFVKAVTAMFSKGGSIDPQSMQQVATSLLKSVEQACADQIKKEMEKSRRRRREAWQQSQGDG